MTWSPDPDIQKQAELYIRRQTKDLLAARDRAFKECESDATKRGLLRSGPHVAAVLDAWSKLLREHGMALLTDLVGLVERDAGLTNESAGWIWSLLERHVDQLTTGTARGLDGYIKRLGIGPPELREHVPQELSRAGAALKADAKLELDTACGEAALQRKQDGPPGETTEPPVEARLRLEGFHPRVQEVAAKLYGDGHYRQAILDVYIALVDEVRRRSGLGELDNTPLMQRAFSAKTPALIVGEDPDEQLGFMWLYSGAVMAIRNPKAHRLIEQNDPQRALEWLGFASVLFRVLEEARTAD